MTFVSTARFSPFIAAFLIVLGVLSSAPVTAVEPEPIRFGILSTAQPARIHAEWGAFVGHLADYLAPRAYLYAHGVKSKGEEKEVFSGNLTNSLHRGAAS